MGQETWVHWDYSPEEWALFDRMDWGVRLRRRAAIWLLIGLPIALVVALFFFFLGGPLVVGLVFALTLLIVFGLGWYVDLSSWDSKRHQARRKRGQPRRVTLSKDGVWLAGAHFPLSGDVTTRVEEVTFIHELVFLEEVTMTSEPPVLHFRRALAVMGSSRGADPSTLHLLVPRGHEEEAARLMQRYQLEVIAPNKRWLERLNAPPEPR